MITNVSGWFVLVILANLFINLSSLSHTCIMYLNMESTLTVCARSFPICLATSALRSTSSHFPGLSRHMAIFYLIQMSSMHKQINHTAVVLQCSRNIVTWTHGFHIARAFTHQTCMAANWQMSNNIDLSSCKPSQQMDWQCASASLPHPWTFFQHSTPI